MKDFFTAVFYLLITAGVFVLTYYTTKFLSKRAGITLRTKNLQLLEKIPLGKDKQAAILRVGEEYYLVGISNQSVQFSKPLAKSTVAKLTMEEPETAKHNPSGVSFTQILINKIAGILTNMISMRKERTNDSKTPNYSDYEE